MYAWRFALVIGVSACVGCSSGSGSGGGVTDGGTTGGTSGTGATGGVATGGVSGNGGTPTGGAGGTGNASGSGGASGGGGASTGGSGGSAGTPGQCQLASECPGIDGECGMRTCINQICGYDPTPAGFVVQAQTAGDCMEQVCDGQGQIVGQPDAADPENDGNDCTLDTCSNGNPQHVAKAPGAACSGAAGAKVCNSVPACVECIGPSDCASAVCTAGFTCAAASCTDLTKNGSESDVDCGGVCPQCQVGQSCNGPGDCATNSCTGGKCACVFVPNSLILSEVRWRGVAGANDDFAELYNPGNTAVTVTSDWTLEYRSEAAASYTVRFTGANQLVPAHGHLLIGGSVYSSSVVADATLSSGLADEGSLVLKKSGVVVDAVCWNCGANSFTDQVCEGGQVTVTGCANNTDRSLERKPGGALGNCLDNNVIDDWQLLTPALPQNSSSQPTP